MQTPFSGGCRCGAVRYSIGARPLLAGFCQCRDCQRASGTGHSAGVLVSRDAFQLHGEPTLYRCTADSGNPKTYAFCAVCGSPLFVEEIAGVFVSAGSLDDPADFAPELLIYTASGHGWDHVDPALPRFPNAP